MRALFSHFHFHYYIYFIIITIFHFSLFHALLLPLSIEGWGIEGSLFIYNGPRAREFIYLGRLFSLVGK